MLVPTLISANAYQLVFGPGNNTDATATSYTMNLTDLPTTNFTLDIYNTFKDATVVTVYLNRLEKAYMYGITISGKNVKVDGQGQDFRFPEGTDFHIFNGANGNGFIHLNDTSVALTGITIFNFTFKIFYSIAELQTFYSVNNSGLICAGGTSRANTVTFQLCSVIISLPAKDGIGQINNAGSGFNLNNAGSGFNLNNAGSGFNLNDLIGGKDPTQYKPITISGGANGGGICGGGNGTIDGGTYTFVRCSLSIFYIAVTMTNTFGAMCGGGNGTQGTAGHYTFSNIDIVVNKMIVYNLQNNPICGSGNGVTTNYVNSDCILTVSGTYLRQSDFTIHKEDLSLITAPEHDLGAIASIYLQLNFNTNTTSDQNQNQNQNPTPTPTPETTPTPTPTPSPTNALFSIRSNIKFKDQLYSNWINIRDYVLTTVSTTITQPLINIITESVLDGSINLTLKINGFLTLQAAEYAVYLISLINWNFPPFALGEVETISYVINQDPTLNPTPTPTPTPTPATSNICFPAGTPINTDQGLIPIEQIDTQKHTLAGQAILHITQTVTLEKYLIRFEKDAIALNCPNQTTVMTQDHKIVFQGLLVPASWFLKYVDKVKKVAYNGEILYNVLLAKYGTVMVNNLECETLHPKNIIALAYTNTTLAQNTLKQHKIKATKLSVPSLQVHRIKAPTRRIE
jgi:hypothetical protein